ncbi:MAG: hypothetical protein A2V70_11565 [Planctomycetes bacterium RBG_13_63_9]|nr:MAG: hypothetical protein A2V70_11565 [Planctomycetes bacterium RBG_13_63_9]
MWEISDANDLFDIKESIVHVPSVFAYIDPVSGAILLQVIIAGFAGCVAFFRRSIWRFVRVVFRFKPSDKDSAK